LPEQLTPAEIDAFIAKLNDAQVRQVLIAQLKKMSVDQPDAATLCANEGETLTP